jgi:hypothetical protein
MEESYIKLLRKLENWEWYKNSKVLHVFIHLLISANFKDGRFQGVDVKRGQLITGRKSIAESTGISTGSVKSILNKLKTTNEITIKPTNKYSLVTIVKYNDYQCNEIKTASKPTNKRANEQSTNDQQTTTIEEGKEERERKEVFRSFDHLQVSVFENNKLLKLGFNQGQINLIYDRIQNFAQNKKYKSLYLTSMDWLKRDFPKVIAKAETVKEENKPYFVEKWQIEAQEFPEGIRYGNSHQRNNGGLSEMGIRQHCQNLGIVYE